MAKITCSSSRPNSVSRYRLSAFQARCALRAALCTALPCLTPCSFIVIMMAYSVGVKTKPSKKLRKLRLNLCNKVCGLTGPRNI